MITIIHGSDTSASRNYFLELRNKNKEALFIDGQNTNITDLTQAFEGGELFSSTKNYFIEQLVSKRKKSKELDLLIQVINSNHQDHNVYIWEEKELSQAAVNSFSNPFIKSFKLPQTLFLFLDNLRPNNSKSLIDLFHKTLANADVEMVFFMMIRQIRILLALVEPANNPIDEIKRLAPWQKTQLSKQADFFEIDELKYFYQNLFEVEKALKTGSLSSSLTTTIDLMLLEL